MTIFIIAAIAISVLSVFLFRYANSGFDGRHMLAAFTGILCAMAAAAGLVAGGIMAVSWRGAHVQAEIINREYGTNYTGEEVFYASSVIDTIRELQRRRVEVNGDVFREADPNVQARREKVK